MRQFALKSCSDETELVFYNRLFSSKGYNCFDLEIKNIGLCANLKEIDCNIAVCSPLPEFFESMWASWQGWQDHIVWKSACGELEMKASAHITGKITIYYSLTNMHKWDLTSELQIDAGEQLKNLVRECNLFWIANT